MNEEREPRLFAYEKLRVWNDARVLVGEVYALTRGFPKSELFGLAAQLNRAVVSVACNLAEGSARTSAKDQAHFSQLSYSSLMEVSCLLTICSDLKFIDNSLLSPLRTSLADLSARIHKLRHSQLSRSESSSSTRAQPA
ncbi:four helix bundle protein [Verrucomicrobium sp. BvORR034]|jgi:four helix bundle protein|uniref:four helix bundle protein n=1 Tax=Verrucomicrobium sp. BvORR034 TaxID=1396418 RepID=UPI000679C514|nr:four helix bundle protein [Verrucomicrobium sp. BvORR034]